MSTPRAVVQLTTGTHSGWSQLTAVAAGVWDRRARSGTLSSSYITKSLAFGGPKSGTYSDETHLLNMIAMLEPGKKIQYLTDTAQITQLIFAGTSADLTQLLSGH